MAPKKKNAAKKGNDDWEAELGETVAPAAGAAPATDGDAAEDDAPTGGSGGLMNLMRKNKEKRKKKGIAEDFVEGETPESAAPPAEDLTAKTAVEANLDDEFALPDKKGKGKGKAQDANAAAAGGDEEKDASGRVKTKAEKEKERKEKEKQRKKEQVRWLGI
jgi:translation initiation factor 5B